VPLSVPEPPRVPGGIPPAPPPVVPCVSGFCIVGPGPSVVVVVMVWARATIGIMSKRPANTVALVFGALIGESPFVYRTLSS
jgi:hypothetical protein